MGNILYLERFQETHFIWKMSICQIECESLGSQSRFSIFKIIWFKKRCLNGLKKLTPWEIFLSWIGTDLLLTVRAEISSFTVFLEIIKCMTLLRLDSIVLYLWLQTLGDHLADGVGGDDIHSFQSKWKCYQLLLKCRS